MFDCKALLCYNKWNMRAVFLCGDVETGEQAMQVGMLWFDDSLQRELGAKIERAAKHYEAKYGMPPTVCYVHPSMLMGNPKGYEGLDVRANNMVLPNHFWLGNHAGSSTERRTAA